MKNKRILLPVILLLICQTLFSNEWHDQADKFYNQGQTLKRANSQREAAAMFRKSAEAEKKSGSVRNERFIKSIGEAAEIFYNLSEYEESFKYYKLMLAESSKGTADDRWTANTGCGKNLIKLGRHDDALGYLESAVSYAKSSGLNDRLALTHSMIASLYRSMGDYNRALENYQHALLYVKKTGVESNVAVIATNLGILKMFQGKYDEALKDFSEALVIDKKYSNSAGISVVYANIAAAYSEQGRYGDALKSIESSIAASSEGGKPVTPARITAHAKILFAMKDNAGAKSRLDEAIELGKKSGDLKGAAGAHLMLGMVDESAGRKDEAYSNYMQALRINKDILKDEKSADRFSEIAQAYESRSSYSDAFEFYSLAARRNSALKNMSGLAESYGRIGKILIVMGRYREALENFNEEKKIIDSEKTSDPVVAAENLRNSGIALFHLKNYEEAVKNFKQGLSLLSKNEGDRRRFSRAVSDLHSRLIPALCEAGRPGDAVTVSEEDSALRLGLVSDGISAIFSSRKNNSSPAAQTDAASMLFLQSERDVITRITAVNGNLSYSSLSKAAAVRSIRSQYGKDIDAHYESLKVDPKRFIPAGGPDEFYNADFQKIISYYTSLLSRKYFTKRDSETAAALGKELYRLLFDGSAEILKDIKIVAVKADGPLSAFPFDTLVTPDGTYLAEKHDVRMVFSFDIDSMTAARKYPADRKPAVFFADPEYRRSSAVPGRYESELDFSDEVNRMLASGKYQAVDDIYSAYGFDNLQKPVNSRLETETLNMLSNKSSAHYGNSASVSGLIRLSENGNLAGYKIVHFSLYSLIVPEYPELGAVAMSAELSDKSAVRRMGIKEISSLKLKSDVVTLADVNYFRQGYSRGEAVWVLSCAFIAAGAKGVVIPLWEVDDRSRIWFMINFYDGIINKNMEPREAFTLARKNFIAGTITVPDTGDAKISIKLEDNDIKKYRNPYYWGSFIYYGR